MNAVSVLFLLMLLGAALLPFALAFQLTSLAHSIYRNRLWLLRDRITDDLRRGVVSESPSARYIKELVDRQIQVAGRHTLADSLLATNVFDVAGDTSIFDEIVKDGTPGVDRAILDGYLQDFQRATVNHLKWGSVFGWVAFVLFSAVNRMLSGYRTLRRRLSRPAGQVTVPAGAGNTSAESGANRTAPRSTGAARRPKTAVEQAMQELGRKVERAEVEIMPAAAPSRQARAAERAAA